MIDLKQLLIGCKQYLLWLDFDDKDQQALVTDIDIALSEMNIEYCAHDCSDWIDPKRCLLRCDDKRCRHIIYGDENNQSRCNGCEYDEIIHEDGACMWPCNICSRCITQDLYLSKEKNNE